MRFLVGGYTAEMDGRASGIGVVDAGSADDALAGGQLSARPDAATAGGSPSWVARHPSRDVVYAALEGAGSVQAFAHVGEGELRPLREPVAAGELTCHVAVAPDGASLVAACWGDGRVVRIGLDPVGALVPPATVLPPAADPYAGEAIWDVGDAVTGPPGAEAARTGGLAAGSGIHPVGAPVAEPAGAGRRASRAHQTRFLPDSAGAEFATTDMGLDLVRFWRGSAAVQQVVLPRGSGPRHMRWHPSGHLFVVTELSHEVFALAPDAGGTWRIVGGSPLSAGTTPGSDFPAELTLSRDARFIQVGIRGSNTIAALGVRGSGDRLRPIALVESGVDWPRHHVTVRDTVLVAGQLSDEVVSLSLDERTGVPGRPRHRVAVPSPTCLLPLP